MHGAQQAVVIPGFQYEFVDISFVDCGGDGLDVGLAAQDNANYPRKALSHLRQKLYPAHTRHSLIGNNDIHGVGFHQIQAFESARGSDYFVFFLAEKAFEKTDYVHFIINDENRVIAFVKLHISIHSEHLANQADAASWRQA